jgi:hypothetical protein
MLDDVPRIFEAVFQCTLEVGVLFLSCLGFVQACLDVALVIFSVSIR